jgi:hypothetical protein
MSSLPVTNQMHLISEFSEVSVMFFKRGQSLLKSMKVSCLVMIQTHAHIMFST